MKSMDLLKKEPIKVKLKVTWSWGLDATKVEHESEDPVNSNGESNACRHKKLPKYHCIFSNIFFADYFICLNVLNIMTRVQPHSSDSKFWCRRAGIFEEKKF